VRLFSNTDYFESVKAKERREGGKEVLLLENFGI